MGAEEWNEKDQCSHVRQELYAQTIYLVEAYLWML